MSENTIRTSEIENRLKAIEDYLQQLETGTEPASLHEAATHLVRAGGKRLRPLILILAYESIAGPQSDLDDLLPAAGAVELVHTLSLIHDDIIDDDDLRRGVDSVHTRFDKPTGILAGDLLYSTSFSLLLDAKGPGDETLRTCLRSLTRSCRVLCEGQSMDLALQRGAEPSEDVYIEMVEKKTAALFEAAATIGGVLAEGTESEVESLARYGKNLGIAFQLYDDVLDLTATTDTLQKTRGSDVKEEKQTLIAIHAAQQGFDIHTSQHSIEETLKKLEELGSIDYVRGKSKEYVDNAKTALEELPDADAAMQLGRIADLAIERDY